MGLGISPVSVAGGRVFALSQYEPTEYVRALDEQTGTLLWTTELGAIQPQAVLMRWLTQRPPTVDGERLYAMSPAGALACLRSSDGEVLWKRSYPTDFGGKSGTFGFSDCPVVYEETLICTPGGPDASIVALDKRSGKVLWKCAVPEAGGAAYSNGVVAVLAGQLQFVSFLEKTLVGVDIKNGNVLWRHGEFSKSFLHPHTPVIRGNLLAMYPATLHYKDRLKNQRQYTEIERKGLFLFLLRKMWSKECLSWRRFSRRIWCMTSAAGTGVS